MAEQLELRFDDRKDDRLRSFESLVRGICLGAIDHAKLEQEVREYFASHIYEDYSIPFELERIYESPVNPAILWAEPKDAEEEDIYTRDRKWESGLADIGEKFGVLIKLPTWMQSK